MSWSESQGRAPVIGVWRLNADGTRYERSMTAIRDWVRWAECPGFPSDPVCSRVLFFGESAARGMHFDPEVTPAGLLRDRLSPLAASGVEVIDLARTGARISHLTQAAAAAASLRPDAAVCFAGNNWKYELLDVGQRDPGAESRAVAEAGLPGLLALRERLLGRIAERFVRQICEIFDGICPVLFVIPESNLQYSLPAWGVPVLGGGLELAWHLAAVRLRAALAAGDLAAATACSHELHALDGGLSDEAHQCLGEAALERGDVAAALASFRRARDVRLCGDSTDPAWLPAAGVAAATATAAACGASVIDLTESLSAAVPGGIPGRSVFLDWCHLNEAGLGHLADQVAARLAPMLGLGPAVPSGSAAPAADVRAAAYFSSAVHNAHWGQPRETIEADVATAISAAPGIADSMRRFLRMRAGTAPSWTQEGLGRRPANLRVLSTTLANGREAADDMLVQVIGAQLDRSGEAAGAPPSSRALRPGLRAELLDPSLAPYWRPLDWEGLLDFSGNTLMRDAEIRRRYFRAHSDASAFTFFLAQPSAVAFDFTGRLGTAGTCSAVISVNDTEIGRVELAGRWATYRCTAGPGLVRAGSNCIRVCWQRSAFETTPLPVIADRMRRGITREGSAVFGEVFSLGATAQSGGPG
jgi:hypothetical protein